MPADAAVWFIASSTLCAYPLASMDQYPGADRVLGPNACPTMAPAVAGTTAPVRAMEPFVPRRDLPRVLPVVPPGCVPGQHPLHVLSHTHAARVSHRS